MALLRVPYAHVASWAFAILPWKEAPNEPEQVAELVKIVQRSTNKMCDELIATILEQTRSSTAACEDALRVPTITPSGPPRSAFTLDNPLAAEGWEEIAHLTGQTYKWPDGNVDNYDALVSHRGTGSWDGLMLALGFLPNGR